MFLHERTRIALCRLGFVALCVLPTLATIGWAISLRTPWHAGRVEASFAQQTGIALALGRVEYPQRGRARWHGVELRDRHTGAVLAKASQVALEQTAHGLRVVAQAPTVDSAVAGSLRSDVNEQLAAVGDRTQLWLSAAELVWRQGEEEFQLTDVRAGIEHADAASQAYLTFRPREPSAVEAPRARIIRQFNVALPPYVVELHTGDAQFPCRLASSLGMNTDWLGADAQFRGSLWSHWTGREWTTQLIGELSHIDLATALGSDSPHQIQASARLQTTPGAALRLRGNRLDRLSATVTAGPGQVSQSLFWSGSRYLGLRVDAQNWSAENVLYPFEQMAFDVQLDGRGLTILGRCDEQGTVMTDARGPRVLQPTRAKTIADLVTMLSAPSDWSIPATPEAQRLASHLPVPAAMRTPVERIGSRPAPAGSTPQQR